MKKIVIFLLLIPLISCNDWLTVESEQNVNYANYFKNEQEVAATLTTMFTKERSMIASNTPNSLEHAGLFCDDLYKNGFRTFDLDMFLDGRNYEKSWASFYNVIYLTNVLEENRWRFKNITEERADFWIAQANFMKALAYFRIAQLWGEAPIPAGSESLEPLAKSPALDVLKEAIKTAEKALILPTWDKLTDENGKAVTSRQYASQGTVCTLLANIYAWMGGLYNEQEYWGKAEEYASRVIGTAYEGGEAGAYSLEGDVASLITQVFGSARKSPEIIFSITRIQLDDNYEYLRDYGRFYPGFLLLTYPNFSTDPSSPEYDFGGDYGIIDARVSEETVLALYDDENDQRRQEYWYELGEWDYTWAFLYKWREYSLCPDVTEDSPIVAVECDKVIWRLADLILLRAECRARLNQTEGALADLNKIRARAGMDDYEGNKDAGMLRREIFRERERELLGEGHRYFDIVRNGVNPRDNYYLQQISKEYANLSDMDIANGALYMPVSDDAFTKNPYMKQNTFWLWKK